MRFLTDTVSPFSRGFIQVKPPAPYASSRQVDATAVGQDWSSLIRARGTLGELSLRLASLDRIVRDTAPRSGSASKPARVSSAMDLGLGSVTRATTLRSTEEINMEATSMGDRGPDWSGSTASVAVGGNYDGSDGTGDLTFQVDQGGTHGLANIRIDVYDPGMAFVEQIVVHRNHAIDRVYTLGNGLELTFGAGDMLEGDLFKVSVDATDPGATTPLAPAWQGNTAAAVLDGVYDGTNGTDTLRIEVDTGGEHGADNLRLYVYDGASTRIDTINVNAGDAIDAVYTLDNGITFQLGAGSLAEGSSFTLDVDASSATQVDPTRAMDGVGSEDALLQDGLAVADGSFFVNGVEIAVSASDSIHDVLGRINLADANVIAAFDAFTETVFFTHESMGSSHDIVLAGDSSGFLAAMKLTTAVAIPGQDGSQDQALAELPMFAGVSSGAFLVNGESIALDVNADSLVDLVDRINASSADVIASWSADGQRIRIVGGDAGENLDLDSQGTGLFTALHIEEGRHRPRGDLRAGRLPPAASSRIASSLSAALEPLSELGSSSWGASADLMGMVQSSIRSLMRTGVGNTIRTSAGLPGDRPRLSLDRGRLARELSSHEGTQRLVTMVQGEGGGEGSLTEMRAVIDQALRDLGARMGSLGNFVNTRA